MAEHEKGAHAWSLKTSTACTTVGAACLWAWGYVVSLTTALFPDAGVVSSIGVEYGYYASQVTLLVLAFILVFIVRRKHPALPPAVTCISAVALASTACIERTVLGAGMSENALYAIVILCGIANGIAGMFLTIAWGARFTLGAPKMRRTVLLSFLLGYALLLVVNCLPSPAQFAMALALPLTSGGLWMLDSRQRHLLTREVWPGACANDVEVRMPGEMSAGSASISLLPWNAMLLFGVASLVGNFVSSYVMGASYNLAETIFPLAFLVCGCITTMAMTLVSDGEQPLAVVQLYKYVLPLAVLGMLALMVSPTRGNVSNLTTSSLRPGSRLNVV